MSSSSSIDSQDMVTGPKVEETTTHEPDKAGFTPASDSSDDDEVDPILKEEFYRQLDESEGFDVDITIPQISFSTNICEDNDRYSSYRDMLDMYARVGLHWYNFHKGSNFQFSTIYKYNSWNIFDYYITLEAMDPADKSSFTFQARVIRAASVNDEHLRILSEGCRIKPQIPGTGDEIHPWDYPDGIDEFYNGNLPKWYSDDALMMPSSDDKHHQFYEVQDSDIRENDWLKMYAEIALYSLHESDKWLLQSWLPVEINKVVVQTYEDVKSSKEKLKAGNAIFYIAFKSLNAPPNGLLQDHRAIVRRTTDGVPGHVCLEFKCWLQDAEEDDVAQGSGVAGESAEVTDDTTSADYYFDSDSHFGIHEEMFKDVVRAKTYQNVIYKNKFLIKDKIVLDVGAGTGILSLLCAKAGAAHVYAVECSQMADMAKEIVKANGFSDVITVLKGKIEEIELPTPKVDVIISEWMGYFLLFGNMLDSVLYARDKWLVDGGVVLPDRASLHLTAIEDSEYKEDKIDIWNSVYGFDMSCIKKKAMMEPLIDTVDQNQIVTDSRLLKTMDISKMSSGDASFTAPFKLVAQRNGYIHALVAYFDVSFTMCHQLLGFSTGPKSRATHWKQTVMYLEDVLTICEGETITGSMSVSYNKKNPRDIDIKLNYSLDGQHSKIERTQHYKMRWKFSQKKQNFNSTAETEKIHVAPFGSESQQQRSKTKKSHQFSLIPSTLVLFSVAATLICRFRRR